VAEGAERAATLVSIARDAIAHRERPAPRPWPQAWLQGPGASFVTLRLDGDLRGCIGTIQAHRPLGDDVASNAFSAAYRDPRFPPVAEEERERLGVEVSVLTPRVPMAVGSEAEALAAMRPGVDGIYLEFNALSATFLPQVWENLPDPLDFLSELRRKAGLPARFWDEGVHLSRYTVVKYA
jgi:AmmeMemoRadiSam system protein A